jgi:O-antigen/teichoic acid export membrane protein
MKSTNLELRRFARDNVIMLSRIFGMSVFSIVISVILARFLGTEGKGAYDLVLLLVTLVGGTIFNLGIPLGNTYFTANQRYDLKTIVSTSNAILIVLIPITVLVGFVVIRLDGHNLFGGLPVELLMLGLLLMPFFVIDQVLSRIFSGLQDFRALGLIDNTQPLISAVLLLILAVIGQLTIVSAIFTLVLGYVLTNGLTIWLLRSRLSGWRDLQPRFNKRFAKDLLIYGLKIYPNVIISTLLLRLDVLLISNLGGGPASVGIYGVAVTLGERIWTLTGFTSTVLLPRIASWPDADDKRNQLTLLVGKYTLWASIIAAIALIILGPLVISLYPLQFSGAYNALVALLPGIMMLNLSRIFSSDLVGRGKGGLAVPVVVAATILNVLLNLVLIPRYDFVGASLASTAAYSLHGLVIMALFIQYSNSRWRDLILLDTDDARRLESLLKLLRASVHKMFGTRFS